MARRNVLGVFKDCESQYPKCLGTQTLNSLVQVGDETLRQSLPSFFNKILDEVEEAQRWRRNFQTVSFTTSSPTAYYANVITPNQITYIHKVYWIMATGRVVPLELMDQQEPRAIFGEGSLSIPGCPRYYSLMGDSIELFPAPDANGPNSGNYTIFLDCYTRLPHVIPGVCTTAGTGVVSVPSSQYYTDLGVDINNAAGNYLTIRGAGHDSGIAGPNEFDDYTDTWTLLAGNAFTMASSVPGTLTSVPIFVNSVNWLLDIRPQVLLFGILRQVTSYLQAPQDYQTYEARYQKELMDLMDWDNQFRHDNEVYAAAVRGQQQPQLTDINYIQGSFAAYGPNGWW